GGVIAERSTGGALETPRQLRRPTRAEPRGFDIVHRTVYRYAKPVERSTHLLRLSPVHDQLQRVLAHALTVSVPAQSRDYEDVFGNRVRRIECETPFSEMIIEARTQVEVLDIDPLGFGP